ncbi:hypothetical protein AVEN_256927-1 [Araneus ventricosus]|uniref:Integrase catalytic domain-containing protein n=1 Tax=Araneus ventricosus TaxID=182803 RepID=A0A4Y2CI05_ARAVE|nr:hypothetical protein AVEN_256927-1 [Araneus ventricosus]
MKHRTRFVNIKLAPKDSLARKSSAFFRIMGREFRGLRFQKNLENMGIKVEFTNVHTPNENGVEERYNYATCDGIKALNSSGLPQIFWGEDLPKYTYCWNRSVHSDFKKTPFELYGGFKPSVTRLKPF